MKNLFENNRVLLWLSNFIILVFTWRAFRLYDEPGHESDDLFYNWKFNALLVLAGFILMMIVWYLNWKKNPEKY